VRPTFHKTGSVSYNLRLLTNSTSGGGGVTQPVPMDGGVEELHGDPTSDFKTKEKQTGSNWARIGQKLSKWRGNCYVRTPVCLFLFLLKKVAYTFFRWPSLWKRLNSAIFRYFLLIFGLFFRWPRPPGKFYADALARENSTKIKTNEIRIYTPVPYQPETCFGIEVAAILDVGWLKL